MKGISFCRYKAVHIVSADITSFCIFGSKAIPLAKKYNFKLHFSSWIWKAHLLVRSCCLTGHFNSVQLNGTELNSVLFLDTTVSQNRCKTTHLPLKSSDLEQILHQHFCIKCNKCSFLLTIKNKVVEIVNIIDPVYLQLLNLLPLTWGCFSIQQFSCF